MKFLLYIAFFVDLSPGSGGKDLYDDAGLFVPCSLVLAGAIIINTFC